MSSEPPKNMTTITILEINFFLKTCYCSMYEKLDLFVNVNKTKQNKKSTLKIAGKNINSKKRKGRKGGGREEFHIT